jgi:hypothetical protein
MHRCIRYLFVISMVGCGRHKPLCSLSSIPHPSKVIVDKPTAPMLPELTTESIPTGLETWTDTLFNPSGNLQAAPRRSIPQMGEDLN